MTGFKQVGEGKTEQVRDFRAQEQCHRCGGDAGLTLYEVGNTRTGEIRIGAASEFSNSDKAGNNDWTAKDGLMVTRAIGWCGDCYLSEAQAQRLERAASA